MKIHMIGIGGLGISALAKLYVHRGHQVSGTNNMPSPKTLEELESAGVEINYEISIENVDLDTELIVYSNAWPKKYPEFFDEIRSLGIKLLSYPEALGEITQEYSTVCIAGTHGKTTTTAMVLHILRDNNVSATGIVGSIVVEFNSNFVAGDSNVLVIEADEYMRAFLNHKPAIVGVTNIDHDHHDIYPTFDDMKQTFRQLGENLPQIGTLVCSALDQPSWDTYEDLTRNIIDYSRVETDFDLHLPGEFNRKNAQLAIAITSVLGINEVDAKKSLGSFKGTWRRQEYKGETDSGQVVYDDYAHHPTEIAASVSGFKEKFIDKKITIIFQPHLYSRTKELFKDFVATWQSIDINQLIIVPVYAARESLDPTATSQILTDKIRAGTDMSVNYAKNFTEAVSLINQESEIVITMGAGDITDLSNTLTSNASQK